MSRAATYNRTDVLKKARDLFWSKGFRGTSLKDLEAALDLRPGSIYAGFGSKEALFSEALELYAEDSARVAQEMFAAHASPLAGIASHIRRFGRICDGTMPARACMIAKTILETPDEDEGLRALAERMMAATEATFRDRFRAARDAGEIAPDADPDRLARRMLAGIIGLRAYAQRTVDAASVEALAEDLAAEFEALRTG